MPKKKSATEMSLHDRVEFALRDAGFDLDEAARIAALAQPQDQVKKGLSPFQRIDQAINIVDRSISDDDTYARQYWDFLADRLYKIANQDYEKVMRLAAWLVNYRDDPKHTLEAQECLGEACKLILDLMHFEKE